jgi:putative ABC transport system permease protein
MGFFEGQMDCIYDTVKVYETGHIKVVSSQYEMENEFMPVQYHVAEGKNWRELAASIKEISGVISVFPRISSFATLQEDIIKHAVLWGIDIQNEIEANHFNLANRDDGLLEGHWPNPDANECAIGIVFAEKSGLRIGDNIPLKTVSAQFSDKIGNPVITGIFNFDYYKYDEGYIVVDFRRLQRLLVLEEGTQSLLIYTDDERKSGSIAVAVQNLLGNENLVSDWNENIWIMLAKANLPVYIIIYSVLLLIGSFLIINTITLIIHERIKEIGMMGCLGMTRFEILKVFLFESVFMAGFGALAGVIIGGVIIIILTNFPVRMGSFDAMSDTIFFKFSIVRIVQVWLLSVIITSLCTIIPSLKSVFYEPVEALRR